MKVPFPSPVLPSLSHLERRSHLVPFLEGLDRSFTEAVIPSEIVLFQGESYWDLGSFRGLEVGWAPFYKGNGLDLFRGPPLLTRGSGSSPPAHPGFPFYSVEKSVRKHKMILTKDP